MTGDGKLQIAKLRKINVHMKYEPLLTVISNASIIKFFSIAVASRLNDPQEANITFHYHV